MDGAELFCLGGVIDGDDYDTCFVDGIEDCVRRAADEEFAMFGWSDDAAEERM